MTLLPSPRLRVPVWVDLILLGLVCLLHVL